MKFRIIFPALLLCSVLVQAQLCNNNLGDPIVNVTFGTREKKDIPSVTSYERVGGCPAKGKYTINDFLFGCGGYWVQMTGDHTPGDINGNYMMVNAESTPGIVHQDTATGLCDNMLYQYSAYITNVLQDPHSCGTDVILPNLTFSIETFSGEVLATYNTGDIPITNEKKWVQYGFTYKTTPGINEVILKISTNPKYGCGSAFAIDDIVFQNCGPSVKITIDGDTSDRKVCADYTNPFVLQGSYSVGFDNPVVQWQSSLDTGKTWKDITGAITTTYKMPHRASGAVAYRMIVAEKENINSPNCRIRSNAINTEVHPVPAHNPPQYISACSGKDYALPPANLTALEIAWAGPNGFSTYTTYPYPPDTVHDLQYADTGLYVLYQVYHYGCTTTDSFYLSVRQGITLFAEPSYPVCAGTSQTLSVTASEAGSFKWTPPTGLSNDAVANPVATPQDSTVYKVIVTNAGGCQDSAFLSIDVYKPPAVSAGSDKIILAGDTAMLDGSVKGTAINYYWSPPAYISDANAIQPTAYPVQDITYTLSAFSTVGCGSAADDVHVTLYKDLFIPNSFTPNGDGLNDKFRIRVFDNYKILRFVIYNRWGSLVYSSTNATDGWDGAYKGYQQQIGAYVYYLEMESNTGRKIVKQGTVQLLR
jgi:gliding motility-associated-like protein